MATALLFLGASLPLCAQADDAQEIRHLIARRYDKPGKTVQTEPVVIVGGHAVADWVQGTRGGRALLAKSNGQWTLRLCSGAGLKTVDGLAGTGVPKPAAVALAKKLEEAEAGLPHALRARFDLFGEPSGPGMAN
ncbi:MAG: copper uptake system-associated protein [bacterium]|nr:copper uptake system-associated protein [bacterium]